MDFREGPRASFAEQFAIARAKAAPSGLRLAVGAVEVLSADGPEGASVPVTADMAERLKGALRRTDIVLRHDAHALVFIAEDVDAEALDALGRRVVRVLSEPAASGNGPGAALPAVGMAVWSGVGDAPESVLKAAQNALQEVKRRGGNGWCVAASPAAF